MCSALAISDPAAANISTPPVVSFGMGLLILFLVNLPINLFLLSLFVLGVCQWLGKEVGRIPRTWEFMLFKLFGSAVIVSTLGAIIDLALVYDDELTGLAQNSTQWLIALILIFASIFLSSVLVIGIRALPSLIPAAGMTAINLGVWYAFSESPMMAISLLMLSLIGVILVGFAIRNWMKKENLRMARAS